MRVEEVRLAAEEAGAERALGAPVSVPWEMLVLTAMATKQLLKEAMALVSVMRHPEHHEQRGPCPRASPMRVQACRPQQPEQQQQPWSKG